MGETPRPQRWQRWSVRAMAALGVVILGWALWGFLRIAISAHAPGATAGGAATIEERCSRSVPPELAKACIAESRHRAATATLPLEIATAAGGILVALAIGISRAARRRANRRNR